MNTEAVHNKIFFRGVKDGDTFTVAGMEFIKFPDMDGKTPVVMKNIAFLSEFGSDNNLKKSRVLHRMEKDILPKIVEAVGEENVLTFRTDLTTLDGLKLYGELESRISLPTLDFYRKNVEIFDEPNPGKWWWLATPESAQPHSNPSWILCVSPSGGIDGGYYSIDNGVRPFLIFNSSIFGSSEAEQ